MNKDKYTYSDEKNHFTTLKQDLDAAASQWKQIASVGIKINLFISNTIGSFNTNLNKKILDHEVMKGCKLTNIVDKAFCLPDQKTEEKSNIETAPTTNIKTNANMNDDCPTRKSIRQISRDSSFYHREKDYSPIDPKHLINKNVSIYKNPTMIIKKFQSIIDFLDKNPKSEQTLIKNWSLSKKLLDQAVRRSNPLILAKQIANREPEFLEFAEKLCNEKIAISIALSNEVSPSKYSPETQNESIQDLKDRLTKDYTQTFGFNGKMSSQIFGKIKDKFIHRIRDDHGTNEKISNQGYVSFMGKDRFDESNISRDRNLSKGSLKRWNSSTRVNRKVKTLLNTPTRNNSKEFISKKPIFVRGGIQKYRPNNSQISRGNLSSSFDKKNGNEKDCPNIPDPNKEEGRCLEESFQEKKLSINEANLSHMPFYSNRPSYTQNQIDRSFVNNFERSSLNLNRFERSSLTQNNIDRTSINRIERTSVNHIERTSVNQTYIERASINDNTYEEKSSFFRSKESNPRHKRMRSVADAKRVGSNLQSQLDEYKYIMDNIDQDKKTHKEKLGNHNYNVSQSSMLHEKRNSYKEFPNNNHNQSPKSIFELNDYHNVKQPKKLKFNDSIHKEENINAQSKNKLEFSEDCNLTLREEQNKEKSVSNLTGILKPSVNPFSKDLQNLKRTTTFTNLGGATFNKSQIKNQSSYLKKLQEPLKVNENIPSKSAYTRNLDLDTTSKRSEKHINNEDEQVKKEKLLRYLKKNYSLSNVNIAE